jgi:hypothetical protein
VTSANSLILLERPRQVTGYSISIRRRRRQSWRLTYHRFICAPHTHPTLEQRRTSGGKHSLPVDAASSVAKSSGFRHGLITGPWQSLRDRAAAGCDSAGVRGRRGRPRPMKCSAGAIVDRRLFAPALPRPPASPPFRGAPRRPGATGRRRACLVAYRPVRRGRAAPLQGSGNRAETTSDRNNRRGALHCWRGLKYNGRVRWLMAVVPEITYLE